MAKKAARSGKAKKAAETKTAAMRARLLVEDKILDVVRKEVRRAMRLRTQTQILIDPWSAGGGAYVFASTNEPGHTYEIAP